MPLIAFLPSSTEDRYNVAGDEVTIDKVERDDQDTIVQCVASQVFEEHGYTNVETRKVSIDVWCTLLFFFLSTFLCQ